MVSICELEVTASGTIQMFDLQTFDVSKSAELVEFNNERATSCVLKRVSIASAESTPWL